MDKDGEQNYSLTPDPLLTFGCDTDDLRSICPRGIEMTTVNYLPDIDEMGII